MAVIIERSRVSTDRLLREGADGASLGTRDRLACAVRGILLVAVLPLLAPTNGEGQDCLPSEPAEVTVQGTLAVVVSGAPGFRSALPRKLGDQPLVLLLDKAICVEPDAGAASQRVHRKVKELELVGLDQVLLKKARPLVQRRVAVRGRLFSAESSHSRTAVVIHVTALRQL